MKSGVELSSAPRKALAFAVLIGGLLGCGEIERPDGGRGLLPVGAKAPDFEATDAQGAKVRFSTVKGTRVVYFYPKDDTPGCTKEACAFRDAFQRYTDKGITIFGVSRDAEESHRKFRENHRLPFPLAADESGGIQAAYGVPSKFPGIAARVTFLVDENGKVLRVFEKVDPAVHAEEILVAIN